MLVLQIEIMLVLDIAGDYIAIQLMEMRGDFDSVLHVSNAYERNIQMQFTTM